MEYYTYIHSYPKNYPDQQLAGTTFYVGKGQGDRINDHEREARRGYTSRKCDVIREIWNYGFQVVKTKVLLTEVEQDALIYEWVLINLVYGYENLTNFWEGGNASSTLSKPVCIMLSQQTLTALDRITSDTRAGYIRRVLQTRLEDIESLVCNPLVPCMLAIKPRCTFGLHLPLDLIDRLQVIRPRLRSAVIEFLVRSEIGLLSSQ